MNTGWIKTSETDNEERIDNDALYNDIDWDAFDKAMLDYLCLELE